MLLYLLSRNSFKITLLLFLKLVTKLATFIKLASTNYSYHKKLIITSKLSVKAGNMKKCLIAGLNFYKCECMMAWKQGNWLEIKHMYIKSLVLFNYKC